MNPTGGAVTAQSEQKIVALIQKKPKGVTGDEISQELADLDKQQQVTVINKLLKSGQIGMVQRGKTQCFVIKNAGAAPTMKGADNEEKIVYNIIQQGGDKGVWVRDIRRQSQLYDKQVDKVLKSLESKKFIKEIKSIAAGGKKKLYMVYGIEPHRSVTGGAFYQGREFETEFVDVLTQQSYRFLTEKSEHAKQMDVGPLALKKMSYASWRDVAKFIADLGISKVQLNQEEVISILDSLFYDGKVDKTINANDEVVYGAIPYLIPTPGLMKTPCGFCPIQKNCGDSGDVTPLKCPYFNEWLDVDN
ncbi:probable DNA-directed RNA polymerase III subunit RPC6 [Microplitis mediator]|uniref:probable DNA-directed RNA polymerase III subunit RPC6 n=1 Tax=Microplitis mediator TaxID=375433 RepID=UPI00255598C7|nr:probable DNA-directed RNA polymerase III subunit RPC6 [Microplitis mediator]